MKIIITSIWIFMLFNFIVGCSKHYNSIATIDYKPIIHNLDNMNELIKTIEPNLVKCNVFQKSTVSPKTYSNFTFLKVYQCKEKLYIFITESNINFSYQGVISDSGKTSKKAGLENLYNHIYNDLKSNSRLASYNFIRNK